MTTTQSLAGSTRSVAREARLLLRSLEEDPVPDPQLVERLEAAAAARTEDAGAAERGFDATGPAGTRAPAEPVTVDDALAEVLADLSVGQALLAAGAAVGAEGAPRDTTPLHDAVGALDDVATVLDTADAPAARGFATSEPSADVGEATTRLRRELDTTLDEVTASAASVMSDAVKKALERAPGGVDDLIKNIGGKTRLGEYAHRFVKLGAAIVEKALAALARLIPASFLASARDDVRGLVHRLQDGEAAPAVVGWVIAVDPVREAAAGLAPEAALGVDGVDRATDALRAIRAQFQRLAKVLSGIVTAIVGAAGLLSFFSVTVPHLAVLTAGALLVVVAAAVLIAVDFTDGRPGPGFVTGARTVVLQAWGPV